MGSVDDDSITKFFKLFADYLSDDERFSAIKDSNDEDVRMARSKGRSTTRLILSEKMRTDMVAGLRLWENTRLKEAQPLRKLIMMGGMLN